MDPKVIVLEFNELTPALMERFIAAGHLPNFAKLRSQSIACTTDAKEDPPALEPWIQWVSVHTGLSFAEHGVFDLGDGEEFHAPRMWDHVDEAGKRSLVCGSMNASVQHPEHRRVNLIPDPWAVNLRPLPQGRYDDFYHFIRTYVQEYTAQRPPLNKRDYARAAAFLLRNGLSTKTLIDAATQLAAERTGAPKWRRAVILDRLLWDVFRSEWRRMKPALSTIFLNSTAHFQHYYWRDMEPSAFQIKADPDSRASDAILFGYKRMDRIVGECLEMVDRDTTIVLCSALGQQPLTRYEETGGKQIFKVRDATVLLRFAGYRAEFRYSPVMAEQFHLIFENEENASDAFEKLSMLKIADMKVMDMRRDGREIFAGCGVITDPGDDAVVTTPQANKDMPFSTLFYPVDDLKSGMHHPDGILWISEPSRRHKEVARKVELEEIAPTLLCVLGLHVDGKFKHPAMPEVVDAMQISGERLSA